MNKKDVTRIFNKAKSSVSKHKPEILMAVGVGCMIASTVTAVKATPKAMQLLEDEKKAQGVEKLTVVDTIKTTWKCYIPTTVSGVVGVSCLIGASSVSARRSAALATAYKLSETAFSEYKEKVIETIGEKKEKTVREKVNKKKLESEKVRKSEVIVTGCGTTVCYDAMFGRKFHSDMDKIKKAMNTINERLLRDDYIALNDFWEEVGLPAVPAGELLGWDSEGGLIELVFDSILMDDGVPVLTIEFNRAPEYDYYKFS